MSSSKRLVPERAIVGAQGEIVPIEALLSGGGAFFWLLEPGSPADILELRTLCQVAPALRLSGYSTYVVVADLERWRFDTSKFPAVIPLADPKALLAFEFGVSTSRAGRYPSLFHRAVVVVNAGAKIICRERLTDFHEAISRITRALSIEFSPVSEANLQVEPALEKSALAEEV